MDFGLALVALRAGKKVARFGWNHGVYVKLVSETLFSQTYIVESFLVSKTSPNTFAAWSPSSADILATDWSEVE